MRVPSIGLPADERRIVAEGYRIAERMMADYRDPPSLIEMARTRLGNCRQALIEVYQVLRRE